MNKHGDIQHRLSAPKLSQSLPLFFRFGWSKRCGCILQITKAARITASCERLKNLAWPMHGPRHSARYPLEGRTVWIVDARRDDGKRFVLQKLYCGALLD